MREARIMILPESRKNNRISCWNECTTLHLNIEEIRILNVQDVARTLTETWSKQEDVNVHLARSTMSIYGAQRTTVDGK